MPTIKENVLKGNRKRKFKLDVKELKFAKENPQDTEYNFSVIGSATAPLKFKAQIDVSKFNDDEFVLDPTKVRLVGNPMVQINFNVQPNAAGSFEVVDAIMRLEFALNPEAIKDKHG